MTKEQFEEVFFTAIQTRNDCIEEMAKRLNVAPQHLPKDLPKETIGYVALLSSSDRIQAFLQSVVIEFLMAALLDKTKVPGPAQLMLIGLVFGIEVGKALGQAEALDIMEGEK